MNLEFNKNEDVLKQSLSEMRRRLEKIVEGGGKKAIEKQREKNKLTHRERIDYLIDKDKPFFTPQLVLSLAMCVGTTNGQS